MGKVVIIVNSEVAEKGQAIGRSPVADKMVSALKRAIEFNAPASTSIEIVSNSALWSNKTCPERSRREGVKEENPIYCPLTIQVPYWLSFPAQETFQMCRDIPKMRSYVEQKLGYQTSVGETGLGDRWLPIVLTKKGLIYGELIEEGMMPNFYHQPVGLPTYLRQSLYGLAQDLLGYLSAPPSVYLLQFSVREKAIVFDRFWPFPAAPALASINVQKPDLFTCYWQCLTGKNIKQLSIAGPK